MKACTQNVHNHMEVIPGREAAPEINERSLYTPPPEPEHPTEGDNENIPPSPPQLEYFDKNSPVLSERPTIIDVDPIPPENEGPCGENPPDYNLDPLLAARNEESHSNPSSDSEHDKPLFCDTNKLGIT